MATLEDYMKYATDVKEYKFKLKCLFDMIKEQNALQDAIEASPLHDSLLSQDEKDMLAEWNNAYTSLSATLNAMATSKTLLNIPDL